MTRAPLALALVLAGCAAGPYQSYRSAHPEWDGAFPTADADVSRTVAALHAPGRGYTVTVENVQVWRLDEATSEWIVSDADIVPRRGDYAVVASLHCASSDGTTQFMRGVNVWYLLPNDELAAYDHYAFRAGCDVSNAFQPARDSRVAREHEILARAGLPKPAQATGAAEAYQKGSAFLRAGRRDDAKTMLAQGDSLGSGEFGVRARFNVPHSGEAPLSPAEARAALVRGLNEQP